MRSRTSAPTRPRGASRLRPDPFDQPGPEILLDALDAGRWCRAKEVGGELWAVIPVAGPPAAGLHELAGRDRDDMADDRHQIAMAANLDPKHGPAVIGIVEGHALDKAGERFAVIVQGFGALRAIRCPIALLVRRLSCVLRPASSTEAHLSISFFAEPPAP